MSFESLDLVWQVFWAALATALATGVGALPFAFVPKLSPRWQSITMAAAGGMMISASVFSLATEALKLILGLGEPLAGRLLHFDALSMRFRETRLPPDPDCPGCAPGKPFPGYRQLQALCLAPGASVPGSH